MSGPMVSVYVPGRPCAGNVTSRPLNPSTGTIPLGPVRTKSAAVADDRSITSPPNTTRAVQLGDVVRLNVTDDTRGPVLSIVTVVLALPRSVFPARSVIPPLFRPIW